MKKEQEDAFILVGVRWAIRCAEAVQVAGGGVALVREIPDDLTISLARNNLTLTYRGPTQ